MMVARHQSETDFPEGHPARFDYDPASPEAADWMRRNVAPLGERDFPIDHPKAADTPGNTNHIRLQAGVDPHNPHLEPFTGRTPEQAAGVKRVSKAASEAAKDSPVAHPVDMTVLGPMLDAKRKELHVDVLTSAQYEDVMRDYHIKHAADVVAKAQASAIPVFDQALSYVMSRGYTEAVAREIVQREGAQKVLEQAGLA